MDFPLVIDGMYLTFSVIVLGVAVYGWLRRKQRRLAANRRDRYAKIQASPDAVDDGFYCIMLNNGTCRSGYIDRPPTE